MLGYYISQSNDYTIRTQDTASGDITLSLTDMMGLNTFTASISDVQFTPYENILAFTASISGAIVASEYRAVLIDSIAGDIWNGSIQVYASQSLDKAVYENKNTGYISHQSENKYIIYE
jgi:WD40 repeat protein